MRLYTRYEHGSLPVDVSDDPSRFTLLTPDGPHEYPSARQLLIYLTRHAEARHWTFDRYFRLGRFDPYHQVEPIIPALELFAPGGIVIDTSQSHPNIITSHAVTIAASAQTLDESVLQAALESLPTGNFQQSPSQLGIDLVQRGHEVEKLLFSGFRGWIYSAGYDPRDVLQEVYKGILIRNQGTCPFDERKSSFGHYVHQVCHCVLSNYHRRETRHYSMETTGIMQWTRDGLKETDVAESTQGGLDTRRPGELMQGTLAISDMLGAIARDRAYSSSDGRLAYRVLPLLVDGCDRDEMAQALGVKKAAIGRAITFIRRVAKRWKKA